MRIEFQILAINVLVACTIAPAVYGDYGPSVGYVSETEWDASITFFAFYILGSLVVAFIPSHTGFLGITGPLITMSRKSVLSSNPIKVAFILGFFGGMLASSAAYAIICGAREIVCFVYNCHVCLKKRMCSRR